MFYFTCNESEIYESFTFWNVTRKNELFHDILIWDAPVFKKNVLSLYIKYIYIEYRIWKYIFKIYT